MMIKRRMNLVFQFYRLKQRQWCERSHTFHFQGFARDLGSIRLICRISQGENISGRRCYLFSCARIVSKEIDLFFSGIHYAKRRIASVTSLGFRTLMIVWRLRQ